MWGLENKILNLNKNSKARIITQRMRFEEMLWLKKFIKRSL